MNIFITTSSKQLLRTFARNQFAKRKFRVLSVRLRPRGVLRADLNNSENRKGDNSVLKVDAFQSKRKENNTQNINTVDPVVLKYTKFLSDRKAPNVEQRYVTKFGAIRFDEENVPKVHGQYEKSLRSTEETEELGEELFEIPQLAERDERTDHVSYIDGEEPFEIPQLAERDERTDHLNYVDEFYFGQAVDRSDVENKVVGFTNVKNIGMTHPRRDIKENGPVTEGGSSENFIDEVYFGRSLGSSESSNKSASEVQNNGTFSKVEDMGNDELFYPSLKPNEPVSKGNLSTSDRKKDVSDLNYIDNHYFGESLLTRGLNIKPDKDGSENYTGIYQSKTQKDHVKEKVKNDLSESSYSIGTPSKNTSDQKMSEKVSSTNDGLDFFEVPEKTKLYRESSKTLETQQYQRTSADAKGEKFGKRKKESLLPSEDTNTVLESNDNLVPKLDRSVDMDNPKSAYDYVRKLRKEHYSKEESEKEVKSDDSFDRGYKKLIKLQFQMSRFSRRDMVHYLKKSIIYDNYDIIGLYKPFGLPVQEGSGQHEFTLTGLLPDLAKVLKVEKIHVVHRLDIGTTGVILLSRTEDMANTLRKMFHDHKVVKTYWALTKGIPHPSQGLIDIPMEEGMVDGRRRMVLRPNIEGVRTGSNRASAQLALTKYKVLSQGTSCALVEVNPITGLKHQIRAHLGFGLACPVIGDHKYSHLKKLAPQRLPGDLLQCLKIPQSRVRDLPIFLHARSVLLPEVVDGRNILVRAAAPAMFSKALSMTKISKRKKTE